MRSVCKKARSSYMTLLCRVTASSFLLAVLKYMKFILGKKLGMTQVFREDGAVVPVTRVFAGPCVVTQIKHATKDGVDSVQVGFGEQKSFRLNKAKQGHLKDLATVRFVKEFRSSEDHDLKRGDTFSVKVFAPGEKVHVVGTSKGKGFQGVVKRHGFSGGPASHGHKDQLRMPGSIGATDAARVFKGKKMGGRMGGDRVTVKNLEIVDILPEENILLIKGAVPGGRGGLLMISTPEGKMVIDSVEEIVPEVDVKEVVPEEALVKEAVAKEEVVEESKEVPKEEASATDKA